ncbi:helix-turn-helix domain-containing protein [Moorella naiadis]|uniref:IS66 family insertion sequence element accessory protein TnpA n=1 Tax=Moorella naiadis (nom. illeg.) TaxID=3093670 RepID=UPI003D9C9777
MTKAELQELWATRIAEYKMSGQSVREWCATHEGISPRQLWYWLQKYNPSSAPCEQPKNNFYRVQKEIKVERIF